MHLFYNRKKSFSSSILARHWRDVNTVFAGLQQGASAEVDLCQATKANVWDDIKLLGRCQKDESSRPEE